MEAKAALAARLEHESQQSGFWSEARAAARKQAELKAAKDDLELWADLSRRSGDLAATAEILEQEPDEGLQEELRQGGAALALKLDGLDFRRMLSGPYDRRNAILNIHPGAGGTESQDWAQMLLRMYSRWAERRGLGLELIDLQPAEEAGIKNATLRVAGDWAYGLLRAEKGVHRLVRISPFDANARRHTSFASVEALPELDEDTEVEVSDKDLKVETFRASGAGGQHVNRTDSAVRLTHLPTGIVVSCQNDRSQIKNRASAMAVLKARLLDRAERERKEKLEGIAGEKKGINFGSQVRSYVLHPYQLVKDHRTDKDYTRVQAILDGELDPLIEDTLKRSSFGEATPHA